MKKILIPVLLLFIGCSQKEVKIPVLPIKGLQELHDHSQIWFFYKKKQGKTIANINRNNTIISTHWIYNVDRRLPLKEIVESLNKFKIKHASSVHSKKGKHNYFSYADTISKKLSFFLFDSITYVTDTKNNVKAPIKDSIFTKVKVHFTKEKICLNATEFSKKNWNLGLLNIIESPTNQKKVKLYLSFSNDLPFQEYLYYRASIRSLEKGTVKCDKKEVIVENKTADCI